MRGHIVKRSKGSWTLVLNLGLNPATGRRKQQWVTVKGNKKEAERKLAELVHQADSGIPPDTTRVKVKDYLTAWLRDVVAVRNRPRTAEAYTTIVRNHIIPAVGALKLAKLSQATWSAWRRRSCGPA